MKTNIVACDQHVGHYIQRVKDLSAQVETLKAKVKLLESQGAPKIINSIARERDRPAHATVIAVPVAPTVCVIDQEKIDQWRQKLEEVFKTKENAQEHVLLLQSLEKLYAYRSKLKEMTTERLSQFDDEDIIEGQAKIVASVTKFRQRAKGINDRLTYYWQKHSDAKQHLLYLQKQAENNNVLKPLSDYIAYKVEHLNNVAAAAQCEHYQKLFGIQLREISDQNKIIVQMSYTFHQYYLLLTAYKVVTTEMKLEYQNIRKLIEQGIKHISWEGEIEVDNEFCTIQSLILDKGLVVSSHNFVKESITLELEDIAKDDVNLNSELNLVSKNKENQEQSELDMTHDVESSIKFANLNDTVSLFKKPMDQVKKTLFDDNYKLTKCSVDSDSDYDLISDVEGVNSTFVLQRNDIKQFVESFKHCKPASKLLKDLNKRQPLKSTGQKAGLVIKNPKVKSPFRKSQSARETNKENKYNGFKTTLGKSIGSLSNSTKDMLGAVPKSAKLGAQHPYKINSVLSPGVHKNSNPNSKKSKPLGVRENPYK